MLDTASTYVEDYRRDGYVSGLRVFSETEALDIRREVEALERTYPVLDAMQREDLPLLVNGAAALSTVHVFDRASRFIEDSLARLVRDFPELRIVFEHITTADAAAFVTEAPATVAATVTPQHLLYNRNAMLAGGIRPHFYCLPVLKREHHRQALVAAAASGNPKFFLGTGWRPRSRPAGAPESSAPTPPSSSTQRPSIERVRSTGSRDSQASTAPASTACRAIAAASGCCARPGGSRNGTDSAMPG